jgi:peptide subunit release factor 1 (eRF1)
MKITIELDNLSELVSKADLIFLEPRAEKILLKLIDIREQVENAIDQAEKKLEDAALKINPNFKSIRSDKIKVFYRAYGARYLLDESIIALIPTELYTAEKKTIYKVNADAVENWTSINKGMPVGISERERTKSLKFDKKEKDEVENGK